MFGLAWIDIFVVIGYFLFVIAIGIWSMRRIKNQEDYFLAGRRFGKFIQTFAAFGQSTSADNSVGVTTTTFTNGIAGIWSSLLYLFTTPMYWMTMPWMRRLRLITLGDFFKERYGSKRMACVYAVIGSIGMMTIISVGFSAMSKTIVALTPKTTQELNAKEVAKYQMAEELEELQSRDFQKLTQTEKDRLSTLSMQKPQKMFFHLDPKVLIWVVCLIVILYAVMGGLEAAFLTDTLQGIFIIVLSILLLPFAWSKMNSIFGGSGPLDAFRALHNQLPEAYFEILGSPSAIDFTWYYIAMLTVMATINVMIQPNALVATGSAKGEYECRFGFVTGVYMKRACTVLWGLLALFAVVLYHDKVHDPDLVWGYATLDLLGPLNIGLVGLMIACLMAALMSTADCMMITGSSLLAHNIYREVIPNRPESHYVSVGRCLGAVVVIGGALLAVHYDTILQQLKLWWELNVMVAAAFWLGMKWRRANRPAAWCSILTSATVFFILPALLPMLMPQLRENATLVKTTQPRVITRMYKAHTMDVVARQAEIDKWQSLPEDNRATLPKPESLTAGQPFEKTYQLAPKSIFWTKGVKLGPDDKVFGSGTLSLELIMLDKLGCDLTKNPYALNETIRIFIRTSVPFAILMIVALLTRKDAKAMIGRFYVKMKTPVLTDHQADAKELELSYADPGRFDGKKLFPNSNWEFDKWNRTDTVGFVISVLVAVGIIGFLVLVLSIGK